MIYDAVFSKDHLHRWRLSRTWAPEKGRVCWIGHNPSVAGKETNDPTTVREMKFSESLGYGGMVKVNIIPYISTDPSGIPHLAKALPAENARWILGAVAESAVVVAAWGVLKEPWTRWADVVVDELLKLETKLWCLGKTKDGFPRHPLYVHSKQPLVRWR